MKTASTILLIGSGAAVLAAVWAPGAWWQWAITALVLLCAGAGTGAAADKPRDPINERDHVTNEPVIVNRPTQIDQDVAAYKRSYGRKADR